MVLKLNSVEHQLALMTNLKTRHLVPLWNVLARKLLRRLRRFPNIPICSSLSINPLCHTLSRGRTFYSSLVTCYFLLVTRYFLLVTRYFLLVTRYYLLVSCYLLLLTTYSLLVTTFLLLFACHSLPFTCCSLLFIRYSLLLTC